MWYFAILIGNLLLIAQIIRWRRLVSAEGLGLVVTGLMLAIDGVSVTVSGASEEQLQLRIVPGLLFSLGLLSFGFGLFAGDSRPRPLMRLLLPDDIAAVRYVGLGCAIIGLTILGIFFWSEGLSTVGDYITNMDRLELRSRSLGGWATRWSEPFILGIAAFVVTIPRRAWLSIALVIGAMFANLVFIVSKGAV